MCIFLRYSNNISWAALLWYDCDSCKSCEKVSDISVNNFIFIRNKIYISSKEEINLNFFQICIIETFLWDILTYDIVMI